MRVDLRVSVVAFENDPSILRTTLESVLASPLPHRLVVLDHSPSAHLKDVMPSDERVDYRHIPRNPGFGAGHNAALRESLDTARYHLVLNPDVSFEPGTLEALMAFMDSHPKAGMAMPQVLFPDGNEQPLCRLLPSPLDMILRRFLPHAAWTHRRNARYEMQDLVPGRVVNAPNLSGCFMFLRMETLERVGLFDERFFMYFEDVDLCRRLHAVSETLFFPGARITHHFARGSYHSGRLLRIHMLSAMRYFSKWGWIWDAERTAINQKACTSQAFTEPVQVS